MQPPEQTPESTESPAEVEQAFATADALIEKLKLQYAQVQQIKERMAQSQAKEIPPEAESDRLKTKLEELELDLVFTILINLGEAAQSQFQVLSQQESFWQFLRFAGLGFILGLAVKALIG